MADPSSPTILRYALLSVHLFAVSLALLASAVWPAAGAAAMLVPLGLTSREQAFAWMAKHDARLLATQASGERLIVSIPTSYSALSALLHGHLPIAAQAVSCDPSANDTAIPERPFE